jgi:hypothetical protein
LPPRSTPCAGTPADPVAKILTSSYQGGAYAAAGRRQNGHVTDLPGTAYQRYILGMTAAGSETSFSLTYKLRPADIYELVAMNPSRKRRRTRIMLGLVSIGILAVAFTAITLALDQPAIVRDSSGAPSWMYAVDAVLWAEVIWTGWIAVLLSPNQITRRQWRANPELHGRHHDNIDSRGITSTSPGGTETYIPWARFARVRETDHAFYLLDDSEAPRCALPKRSLPRPDLILALREFLDQSVGGQPPATTPSAATGSLCQIAGL